MMERQHYNFTTFGLYHRSTLSTPILVRVVKALVLEDFFCHHNETSILDLELHLRCMIVALRLLYSHGIEREAGSLTSGLLDQLYNRMALWQIYNERQVDNNKKKSPLGAKNYNNEFLIVYARDLIAALPSDTSILVNATNRMLAAATMLGHAVSMAL